jgi:hypothetical protein
MPLIKMMTFCKSPKCPSSESLLSYQKGEASEKTAQKIEKHLEGCEFCTAEVEFYNRFPQSEEFQTATVEIPIPLLELAQALLTNKSEGSRLLDNMVNEDEPLPIKTEA